MKSLVALLDRKKRDRAATLIPVSHPSSLYPSTSPQQERRAPLAGTHRPSARSSLWPPLQQHHAASNPDLPQRPLLLFPESTSNSREESPAQSTSYYTESDDDMLADPFAASSPSNRNPLRSNAFLTVPDQSASRTAAVTPNIAKTAPPSAFQNKSPLRNNRAEWEPSASPQRAVGRTLSQSRADGSEAAPHGRKGRWLRERRSFSNFLRPQPSAEASEAPPVPTRTPERKGSFFSRARSGSAASTGSGAKRAHTAQAATPAPAPAQLRTPATALQSRSAYRHSKDSAPYRDFIRSALESTPTLGSPSDTWVRVGGVGQGSDVPSSPASARRRAMSVPCRPPRPTQPCPSMPDEPIVLPSADNSNFTVEELLPVRRPEASEEPRIRAGRGAHGARSTSLSVSTAHSSIPSEKPGPLDSSAQERQPPRHAKQTSTGASGGFRHTVDMGPSSGLGLKSVLKHRLVDRPTQIRHASDSGHVNQPAPSTSSAEERQVPAHSHVPVSSSEGSLNPPAWRPLVVGNAKGQRAAAKPEVKVASPDEPPISANKAFGDAHGGTNKESCHTPEQPTSMPRNTGSFGSILRGHGLASDSRALPVLDNIWGAFISETAFGSLPPSPINPNGTKGCVANSPQGPDPRRQSNTASGSPDNQRFLTSGNLRKSGSTPPSCPPVAGLPSIPSDLQQALGLSLSSVPRRKRSNPCMPMTPPISPAEEGESKGHALALHVSASETVLERGRYDARSTGARERTPRLARSISSPVVRSPILPSTPFNPEAVPDTSTRPFLSVDLPPVRSISPSTSLSSSQCTPVPGTPIASSFSATTSVSSDRGESRRGPFAVATSRRAVLHDKDEHVRIGSLRDRQPSVHALSPASVFTGGSEVSLSMFPSVPPDRAGGHVQGRDGAAGEHVPDNGLHEKPLPTPPITPAWFAQMFDTPSGDDPEMMDERHFNDHIPLAQSGNLARMRRQKHVHNSSVSTNTSSSGGSSEPHGSPLARRAGVRSSSAPDGRQRSARRV